jgi:hypothetical protein
MATLTRVRRANGRRIVVVERRRRTIMKWMPRRCMLISIGLILAGLAVPLLMAIHLLPITLLLGFVTLVLLGTGGILSVIRCGDI